MATAYLIAGIDQHEPSGNVVVLGVGIYSEPHPSIVGWPATLAVYEHDDYRVARSMCESVLDAIALSAPNLKAMYDASEDE